MTGAVTVELPPADVASPHVHALLESCSVAMRRKATCLLSQDLALGEQVVAVAIVAWDGPARTQARVDVGLHAGESASWQSRSLPFSPGDPESERWRAVGFAIATVLGDLVVESGAEPDKAAPRPAETPPRAAGAAQGAPPPTVPASWWLDGQFVVLTGFERGSSAPGGQLRVSRALGSLWFIASSARVAFQSLTAGGVQLSMLLPGVSAGVGIVPLRLGEHVHFALRLEPIVELVEVTASDSASTRSDRGSHVMVGLEQAVDASWMWSRTVGLVVGAEINEATGPTDITAHHELVARVPAVNLAFEGGIRLTLP
jgi:hypothetical protein